MKEIELKEKRGRREKHFLQEDGSIIAKVYTEDIHYKKDGKFEEIDNTLIKEKDYFSNKSNDYKVWFKENSKSTLMKMEKEKAYLDIRLKNSRNVKFKKGKTFSKLIQEVSYQDILEGLDVEYRALPTKVKESIVLRENRYEKLTFIVDTNLKLLKEKKSILAMQGEDIIFVIEAPYMEDSLGKTNYNIFYELKEKNNCYELELMLDTEWLKREDIKYPVYIDPTIVNQSQNSGLQDIYIYSGDTGVDRNSQGVLKAGVEKVNEVDRINRTLLKFDLPQLGTSSEVIEAVLRVIGTPTSYAEFPDSFNPVLDIKPAKPIAIHRITQDWNEQTANWSTMHDKFASRVESILNASRSSYQDKYTIYPIFSTAYVTDLVKKWYRGTPNYGMMLKMPEEIYLDNDYPEFYAKGNQMNGGEILVPTLMITYRNQNGLESYWNYKTQSFTNGTTYINTFNGNMTGVFPVGATVGGKFPASVQLIYNTNDVVLNKTGAYGKGYKLSLDQEIKEVTVEEVKYFEYLDEDGTVHYFYKGEGNSDNLYQDEDGLNYTLKVNELDYVMTDKNGNKMTFVKSGDTSFLKEIKDVSENVITITRDESNKITKITDANQKEINITYETNRIEVESPDKTVKLNYTNGALTTLQTKEGTTTFSYNDNGLISDITDVTGIRLNYTYYSEKPYKMKKITQYGLNNTIGNFFTLDYGFDTTSITDHKGRVNTLIFNTAGNVVSSNSLASSEDINNAYSTVQTYGDDNSHKNKLLSDTIPVRYIKNYLKNTSFEQDTAYFTSVSDMEKSFSTDSSVSGNRSLKLTATTNSAIEQNISVPKGKYYTFSGYFKSEEDITITLSYTLNGTTVVSSQVVEASLDFVREDVTVYYDEQAESNLKIRVLSDSGITYIDDVQLEEGEVANHYNIIENSDFEEGLDDWTLQGWRVDVDEGTLPQIDSSTLNNVFEVVDFNNQQNKALKVKMNPRNITRFSKEFPIEGKKGDLYNISFWYKNEGVQSDEAMIGNNVLIYFKPVGKDADYCILPSSSFHPNENTWQYFTFRYGADEDYESIRLVFNQGRQANNFYITNLTFYKDLSTNYYNYDEFGNVTSIKDENLKTDNTFGYDKNNQLISATDPKGKNFKFEYDTEKTDRILNSITSMGINNQVKYDTFGNPISTRISKKNPEEITEGLYKIRSRGSEKYVKMEKRAVLVESDSCSNTIWKLKKEGDFFKIQYSILPNYSIATLEKNVFLTEEDKDNEFTLQKNENGSYYIRSKDEFVDEESTTPYQVKALQVKNGTIEFNELVYNDPSFEFYFELVEKEFIENSATYSEDGRFVTSVTDSNFNKTLYEVDSITGLTTSMTDAEGNVTEYQYNDKDQITKITSSSKTVQYSYNDKNLLTKITQGAKEYKFTYDDFLNTKKVMIGNNITLAENEYEENNGNLWKTTYGNNQSITFDYDEFDRMKTIHKMDKDYHYKYDNNGNIAKILSEDTKEKFTYDIGKRIHEYRNNDFKIQYTYDSNDNVTNKKYKLGNITNSVENTFNKDDLITKITLDNKEITYQYDSLGRIKNKNIGNSYNAQYEYVTNGKRTSDLVKSVKNGTNKYSYQYDKLNNITHVYYNDELLKKYSYDVYNELIKEEDYSKNELIEYVYDNSGNLNSKVTKNLTTGDILKTDTYEYSNTSWEDQLTKYNNEVITYDAIGNPLTIGNNITLTWINGRSLNSYMDTSKALNIGYEYNANGIRKSKTINGVETKYILENNNIVYESRGEDIIYYLYDTDGLIGLKYNNDIYYYIRNLQGDIIGILNSNYEQVVSYEYDSWGKILGVKDNQGNEITSATHIGQINPFRYRGYYYDKETGLYYLNSRYYNPVWGRFLNADGTIGANGDILAYNLYAYVSNNPISNADPSGRFVNKAWKWIKSKTKKIVDTANKIVKKVCDIGSKVVNAVSSGFEAIKNAFTVELGVGFGVGGGGTVGPMEASVQASKTFGWSYSNNQFDQYTATDLGVTVGPQKQQYGLGLSVKNYDGGVGNPMTMPWEIWDDSNTTKEITIGATRNYKGVEQVNDHGGFIGITFDMFVMIGITFKIGFTI